MAYLLHLATTGGEVLQALFNATKTMTDFSYFKLPLCTLARALIPKLKQHPQWLAEILISCGRCHSKRNEYSNAIACFAEGPQPSRELGKSAARGGMLLRVRRRLSSCRLAR